MTVRKIYYQGGTRTISKPEELALTDAQVREKWNREEVEERQKREAQIKLRRKLQADGLSEKEIDNLQKTPWREWGVEQTNWPAFSSFVWNWWFEKNEEHPTTAANLKFLKDRLAMIGQLKRDETEKFGSDRCADLITADRAARDKAISSGADDPPRVRTVDECYDHLKECRLTVNKEIERLCSECVPIVKEICDKLLTVADAMADELQGEEIERHAKTDGLFGWQIVPSRVVITLRQLPWRLKEITQSGGVQATINNLGLKL